MEDLSSKDRVSISILCSVLGVSSHKPDNAESNNEHSKDPGEVVLVCFPINNNIRINSHYERKEKKGMRT